MKKTNMTVDYAIIGKLGQQGHFGNVFLAKDLNLDREIVVKEIPKVKIIDESDYFKESKILYETKHPNIVEIHCAGFKEEFYDGKKMKHICLFMPYYENGSLENFLEKKAFSRSEILKIMNGLLQGVHSIHSKNLIHLDIKPDNILFDSNMKPMISDFGVSEYLNNTNQTISPVMPLILKSPESAKFILDGYEDVESQQTDIYQLGVVLYLMLKNKSFKSFYSETMTMLPSSNATKKDLYGIIKNGDIFDFSDLNAEDHLVKILKKMLDKRSSMRYAKILDVSNDISKKC